MGTGYTDKLRPVSDDMRSGSEEWEDDNEDEDEEEESDEDEEFEI